MEPGQGAAGAAPVHKPLRLRVPRIRVLKLQYAFLGQNIFNFKFKQGLDHSSKPVSIQRDLSDNHFIIFSVICVLYAGFYWIAFFIGLYQLWYPSSGCGASF